VQVNATTPLLRVEVAAAAPDLMDTSLCSISVREKGQDEVRVARRHGIVDGPVHIKVSRVWHLKQPPFGATAGGRTPRSMTSRSPHPSKAQRRPGPAAGGAPRGRPNRRRAQERRPPDPRLAALSGAPGPRPRAARLQVSRTSSASHGRRRRGRTGLQSQRPPAGRRARASRRRGAAGTRVRSARLPTDARAVRLVHEMQQPRRDRAVLAVGPSPGHAAQGGRAQLAVAGTRHPRDGWGRGQRDSSGFRTSAVATVRGRHCSEAQCWRYPLVGTRQVQIRITMRRGSGDGHF